jgi:2-keto-4-pentenoate hydratase
MSGLKKGTRVALVSHRKRNQDFSVEEAETILNNPNNHGHWALPEKSKYKLQDGKIISTGSTGTPPQG